MFISIQLIYIIIICWSSKKAPSLVKSKTRSKLHIGICLKAQLYNSVNNTHSKQTNPQSHYALNPNNCNSPPTTCLSTKNNSYPIQLFCTNWYVIMCRNCNFGRASSDYNNLEQLYFFSPIENTLGTQIKQN